MVLFTLLSQVLLGRHTQCIQDCEKDLNCVFHFLDILTKFCRVPANVSALSLKDGNNFGY